MKRLLFLLPLLALTASAQVQLTIVGAVTNIHGSQIQTDSINSNRLDAATRALLGTGGTNVAGPSYTLVNTNRGVNAFTNAEGQLFLETLNVLGNDGSGVAGTNWVLNLVGSVNRHLYFSSVTNTGIGSATNLSTMVDSPVAAAVTNSIAIPTAGVYFLSRITTNTFTRIEEGPIHLQTYVYVSGGALAQSVTAHPEMYVWFTNDTILEIATSGPQVFTETATPTIFNTTMNVATATNLPPGSKLMLRWKADAVANSPTWNFVIGGDYDSHISVNVPAAVGSAGGAPLDGTNTWTGTNVFSQGGGSVRIANGGLTTSGGISATGTIISAGLTLNGTFTALSGSGLLVQQNGGFYLKDQLIRLGNTTELSFSAGAANVGGDVGFYRMGVGVLEINNGTPGNTLGSLAASNATLSGTIKWTGVTSSNPPTSGSGTAFLFAATNSAGTAEIFTMDGAGVIKQISEHAMDAPPQLIDDEDEAPNISKEILLYTGKVRWINRSRSARLQERMLTVTLNSAQNWTFLQNKTLTQWSNSTAFGRYTNQLVYLDSLNITNKDLVLVETFAEYNTRNGLTNGNGLVKANWTADQARFQADYAASFTNSLVEWTNSFASYQTNAITQTNLVAPVYPTWTPPAVQPRPDWLIKRGVQ